MIQVNFPFSSKEDLIISKFLLEEKNNFTFTFKKKIYYNFVRPVIPKVFRKIIQRQYNSHIKFHQNFIYDELISYLKSKIKFSEILKNIFPNSVSSAIILTHDVEEQEGFNFIPSIIELEEKYGFKSSWNIVPYKYKIDEGIINLIKRSGHEIGIHGYNHDGKLYYSEKIFNERVPYINKAIKKYDAVGFRSPMVHRNLVWLQRLNIKYDASCFDYDPFQPFPGGTGSIWPFIVGKFVELPYTLPQDHTIFYVLKQMNISIWKNKINWLIENNGMILALTHPDYLKDKKHFDMYKELLEFIKKINNSWNCLPKEMTEWWEKRFRKENSD